MSLENLISAFVGAFTVWMFNEISKKRQTDRDRRALIGRALACLLALHHRVRVIEDYTEYLVKQLSLPEAGRRVYKSSLEYVLPQGEEFVTRYEEAIDQLAETDPVTAFELREKAKISRLLAGIPSVASLEGASAEQIVVAEQQLKVMLVPALEKAIKELARLHGGATQRRAATILKSKLAIPPEFEALIQDARL